MSDNSETSDKQSAKPLDTQVTDDNETHAKTVAVADDNESSDALNSGNDGAKDDMADDDSQEIKSSDLESESERRCTSASNAGESEYESADDEETKGNDQSFEDTVSEPQNLSPPSAETAEAIDAKEEMSVETSVECVVESESKTCAQIDDKEVTNESNSEIITETCNSQTTDNVCENESKINDLPNDEKTESKVSEELSEVSQRDGIELNDNKSDENRVDVDMSSDKENDDKSETNENDLNDELADEEGGREEIADDMDNEYEDMDESDECSVESDNDGVNKENEEENEDRERQQGDGEESNDSQSAQKDKNLDQDEDKRNPQYIPKRGPFYEHDDRNEMVAQEASEVPEEVKEPTTTTTTEEETPTKPIVIAKTPKEPETNKKVKKVWVERERWGHDLFKEDEQTPKSKDELVNTYGYDIRTEDNAPKARRLRRYGRGPNKYTRQWQDENAYSRGAGRTSPPVEERNERPLRSERNDRNERPEREREHPIRTNSMTERWERPERNERKGSDRLIDRSSNEKTVRSNRDRVERSDRKDRVERNDRRERRPEPRDRLGDRAHQRSNEMLHNKGMSARNERPLNDNNKRFDYEENVEKRSQAFSKDDFPELPNNDLRKKLNSNQQSAQQQEVWKASPRFGGHSADMDEHNTSNKEYKTEPMKIIEAIEHNSRQTAYNDPNVVRTLTFENSKFSQRNSSAGYEYDDERGGGAGRARGRKSADMEGSGRPIRKSNSSLNYGTYSQQKEATDNYRSHRNSARTDRSYHSEEPLNRNAERYYEEDSYGTLRDREPNYISETSPMQKMSIEEKNAVLNRNNESEQTRPKRYSSLRQQQQQQRVIPDNMSSIASNTQIAPTSDNRNINHQFYDSHTGAIQTTPYYTEQSVPQPPRNPYHPYMSPNAPESPQTHATTYIPQPLPQQMPQQIPQQIPQPIPQQMPQRYIPQAAPQPSPDNSRYIPTAVPTSAPVPTHQIPQPLPQAGPPPPTNVITAPPPGAYIPSFPSGYPQFPPAPPPTHVPPGYPGHVPPQQPPTQQLPPELFRGPQGAVYYDPQSQQQSRQISQQRRPKAAIPIVPPPDQTDGDGDKSYVSVNS